MANVIDRIKPRGGFAQIIHIVLVALLPALIFVCVWNDVEEAALALILLSKWRMLAVRPRHWPANVRANSVDLFVGLSFLVFMTHSLSTSFQLVWAVVYAVWLLFIKPRSDLISVSAQAMIGQFMGLIAIFLSGSDAALFWLVLATWAVCYSSARHFFISFEEPYTSMYAHAWGYFGAALVWILGHWLLFYGVISQPALLLTVLGYGAATLYYLDQKDRLSTLMRRQFIFIMVAIVTVIMFSLIISNDNLVR
jgi:hypothetical protein